MAKFYGDECFPLSAVKVLRNHGHDVLTAWEDGRANQQLQESQILGRAAKLQRILLTSVDWLNFIYPRPISSHCGLFHCPMWRNFGALAGNINLAVQAYSDFFAKLITVKQPATYDGIAWRLVNVSMKTPRILMCPPDHYGIEYEINPWMSRSRGSSPDKARGQWQNLHDALVSLGVQVELMTPRPGLPDLVFTANAGLVFGQRFFSSQFRHAVRAKESPYFDAWFAEHGFTVEHLPQELYFEGAGDALFCGPTLFAGYRIRSDVGGHQYLGKVIQRQVLPLELVDPRFYHLDTCFCPLASGEAIYFPDAFDAYGKKVLQTHIPKLLPVPEAEAARFACNAVVVGKTVIVNAGSDQLMADLQRWGYQVLAVELDEFLKAGGSAKCLTLRLDGEEAAVWDTKPRVAN